MKESIGRGVFADDPTKGKDKVVFKTAYLVHMKKHSCDMEHTPIRTLYKDAQGYSTVERTQTILERLSQQQL